MAVVKAALKKSRLKVLNVTFKINDHMPVVKALNKNNGRNTGTLLKLVKVANMMTIQLAAIKATEKSKSEFVSSIERDRKKTTMLELTGQIKEKSPAQLSGGSQRSKKKNENEQSDSQNVEDT